MDGFRSAADGLNIGENAPDFDEYIISSGSSSS